MTITDYIKRLSEVQCASGSLWSILTKKDRLCITQGRTIVGNTNIVFPNEKLFKKDEFVIKSMFPVDLIKGKNLVLDKVRGTVFKDIANIVKTKDRDDWFTAPESLFKDNDNLAENFDNDVEIQPEFYNEIIQSGYLELIEYIREEFKNYIIVENPDYISIYTIISECFPILEKCENIPSSVFAVSMVNPLIFKTFQDYVEFLDKNPYSKLNIEKVYQNKNYIRDLQKEDNIFANCINFICPSLVDEDIDPADLSNKEKIDYIKNLPKENKDRIIWNLFTINENYPFDVCRLLNTILNTNLPWYYNTKVILDYLAKG